MGFESIERSSHARGGRLECKVSMVTIPLHLGTHPTELGSSLGNDDLELVVGPLTGCLVLGTELSSELGAAFGSQVLGISSLPVVDGDRLLKGLLGSDSIALDLSSIHCHMLVGPLDAGIDGGSKSGHGTLLGQDLVLKLSGCMTLVSSDLPTDHLGALSIDLLTLVGQLSSLVELHLCPPHGLVEVTLGLLLVLLHPDEESLLQGSTSLLIESHVAVHLGTDSGNITLTRGGLCCNLLLNVGEVVCQAHAPIGGVGENLYCLLDISGIHGARSADTVDCWSFHRLAREDGFPVDGFSGIGCDVHDRATESKATQEG